MENPVLTKIMMEQLKTEAADAKAALQKQTKDHESSKKKAETLEKQNKEQRKELHKLKLQYDPAYAFEHKQVKKEVMARARAAKTQKNKALRAKGKPNGK